MGSIKSTCSACGSELWPPHNGSTIVCPNCGATHNPDISSGSDLSNKATDSAVSVPLMVSAAKAEGVEELLMELDEKIDELASEIEALRIREQGAPLELGCALFGVFFGIIVVLAVFATVARSYFGGWLFYLVLTLAILMGLYKIAPKIIGRAELPRLARKRAEIEATLERLRAERKRVESLES